MAILIAAGKVAGKHAARAIEARAEQKTILAQHMGDPAVADAQARIEQAKTQRSRNRLIAAGAALAIAGTAGYLAINKIEGDMGRLWNGLKSSTPKPEMSIQIRNALQSVSLPHEAVLVEGRGSGSASLHVRSESSAPVLGTIWNHTLGKMTDRTASAVRAGEVQLIADEQGISLQGIKTPGGWAVEADVNASAISAQRANMHYADEAGKRELHADDDLLVFSGQAGRTADVTAWADDSFSNSCATVLLPALENGVSQLVETEITAAAQLEASLGHADNSRLLRQLGQQPVKVSFYTEQETLHNGFRRVDIAPTSIQLPKAEMPVSTDDRQVDYSGECMVAPLAMSQLLEIQSNQAEVK